MLTFVDNMVIFIALIGVMGIGYYFSKSIKDMESYYLANRSLPWSLVVGTLVASWYGGVGVVGTIGYASSFGLASWFIWSIGAHGVRFPLALWVGPRIHIRTDITIPDVLSNVYGKAVAILGAIFLFIYCSQLGEITATGYIGVAAWGADKVVVGVIIVIITIILTCLGGLMGVAVTDMIFFFFMVASVSIVFPIIFTDIGGLTGIREALAATPEVMRPIAGMPTSKAIMLILLCLNVYADPSFYQRFSASNSVKTGRRAMLTCFSLWLGFDIVLMLAGIIVRAKDPTVIPEVGYIKMILSYLPQGVRGLFIIGLIGAIVSTLDSYYLIGGATLAKDIYGRVFSKEKLSDKKIILLSRIGSCLLGIGGLALAFKFTMVYDAIAFLMSLWMSAAFVPVLMALMYKGKKTPMAGLFSMITGVIAFAYFKTNPFTIEGFGVMEPIIIALPISLIFWIIGNQIGEDRNDDRIKITTEVKEAIDMCASSEEAIDIDEADNDSKIKWLGLDGFLVILFPIIASIIGYSLINNVDFVIGKIVPYMVTIVTTLIFFKYLGQVFHFSKQIKK